MTVPPDDRYALFDAIHEVGSKMARLRELFEAAPTVAEKWPIAMRMLRLGPRLLRLRDILDRMN